MEVQIYSQNWTRTWITGFFIAKISKDRVWVSTRQANIKSAIDLGDGHLALLSFVDCVSLKVEGSSTRRNSLISRGLAGPIVRLRLSEAPIAAFPVSE